jgi:hypothetical protein
VDHRRVRHAVDPVGQHGRDRYAIAERAAELIGG